MTPLLTFNDLNTRTKEFIRVGTSTTVFVTVPVVRRVGVRVALLIGRTVPVMGRVLVSSTVGVWVNSRVGIGAWVGVASRVPPGKLINVGGGFVGVESNTVSVMAVGVGAR